ncbi:hypothetical protein [Nonomuraea sp. KM88]|uniref:hypothetical protein n=1 Tax=Nonomuraea sp. KM88 TaxID=3457427 RepID=UPI003FCCD4FD
MSRQMTALKITVAAGLALAPMSPANATAAKSTTTASAAKATTASFCTAWALADRVDQSGKMYGAGGVRCKGRTAGRLTVTLYRNNSKVRSANEACPRNRYCSASTGTKQNSSGSQEWCARAQFHDVIGGDYYIKWECMIA